MSVNRENIEKNKDEFKGGPEAGWQQVEDAAVEAEKGAQFWNKGMEGVSTPDHKPHGSHGETTDESTPDWDDAVQQSGDLTRPVGTDSDSY